jgi:hypothetical protein
MRKAMSDLHPQLSRRSLLAAGAAGLGLAACGAPSLAPTTPPPLPANLGDVRKDSPNAGPLRTTAQGGEPRAMLEGHDAVAYFTQKAAVAGDPTIVSRHLGVVWRFASVANRDEFERDPKKYMPQFGGYCSNGINYAIPGGGGGRENTWRIYRGKLYVFGGQQARDHFEIDTELNLRLAHHYWNTEIAGHDAAAVRSRRLADRVPHYRSDASLQSQWETLRAAGKLPVMPGQPQVVPAGL